MTTKIDAIRNLYAAIERANMGSAFRFREVEEMAGQLRRAAAGLDRINLARCNGVERWDAAARMRLATWTDEDESKAGKAESRHRAKVAEIVDKLNAESFLRGTFTVRFGGDPRGASVRIFVAPDDPESGNATAYF